MGQIRASMQDICAPTDAAAADDLGGEWDLAESQQLRKKIEKKLAELAVKCVSRRKMPITTA